MIASPPPPNCLECGVFGHSVNECLRKSEDPENSKAEALESAEDGNRKHVANCFDPVEGSLVSKVLLDCSAPSDGDDKELKICLNPSRFQTWAAIGEPCPSSIGHTPYPSRVSTLPPTKPSSPRSYPQSLRPIGPTAHKKFQSITPDDLESLMAPAFNLLAPDCSEDEDDDEGKAIEGVKIRLRKDGSRMDTELDQAISTRVVENWEDLE
ncbi:hypothetical protein NE237_013324 [Protea cynaroides]|uniref:Uncharacterized protein n=1 Tax=Protea cynaroides TaxID=273540 RepID=A0A9Q0GYH2_9MAGN|nr:hypothetical protein NE237_013324 [Protea cynaroides]